MRTVSERYKICLQCIGEEVSYDRVIMSMIKHKVMRSIRKWQNPMHGFYRTEKEYVSALDDVCPNCPYVLEHTVLIKRKVRKKL